MKQMMMVAVMIAAGMSPAFAQGGDRSGAEMLPKMEICGFAGLEGGRCVYKCPGEYIVEPAIMFGQVGSAAKPICGDHIKRVLPKGRAASAPGEQWRSVSLRSEDGTSITVDYKAENLGGRIVASPLWVTVANPRFNGSEQVEAKLLNYYEAAEGYGDGLKETLDLSLPFNGRDFMAKTSDVSIYEAYHSWAHNFRQELAVSVNGGWLTDPVNGTNNFRFKLDGSGAVPPWRGDK